MSLNQSEKEMLKLVYQEWVKSPLSFYGLKPIIETLIKYKATWDQQSGKIIFYGSPNEDITSLDKRKLEVFSKFVNYGFFFSHLEQERLIFFLDQPSIVSTKNNGEVLLGDYGYEHLEFENQQLEMYLDKQISGVMYKISEYPIYLSSQLIDICENDFQTYEERTLAMSKSEIQEARKQTRIARGTLIVSIIALFISIFADKVAQVFIKLHL